MNIKKSGIVTIVGRPNTGKSTLVNAILGEKISIVTNKPQTTRHRICAVLNENDTQMVLIDTPGFHTPKTRLGDYMTGVVKESMSETDACVLMVEPRSSIGEIENQLIQKIKTMKCPSFLVVNKIDTLTKEELLPIISLYNDIGCFREIIPVSARKGDGVKLLKGLLLPLMPEGPMLYPEGTSSDQPDKVFVSEVIREKLLRNLQEEIPHGCAVVVEKLSERAAKAGKPGLVDVQATIYCERETHKGMIIGKQGTMLQKIGTEARVELEELYEGQVNLQLWVKVRDNWRDDSTMLNRLGYK